MHLSVAAGWNQTAEDWQHIIHLAPELCYGIDIDNQLAASATTYLRPDGVAWIGMVLTLPEFRGRGLARHLLTHLLHELDQRGIASIGLDATDMGRPLYESLGFTTQCAIERWSRPGQPVEPLRIHSSQATLELRPGRVANYLGPFLADSKSAAIEALRQVPPEASIYWDLFPHHPYASHLATSIELTASRRLQRMYRGPHPALPGENIVGIAGFEFG